MRTVYVTMLANPENILTGPNTIPAEYKHPKTTIVEMKHITTRSRIAGIFTNVPTRDYIVTLEIEDECFDVVVKFLQEDPFVIAINGTPLTELGNKSAQKHIETEEQDLHSNDNCNMC